MSEFESTPSPETREAEAREGPRIYVASLSDYNAGILHGQWVNASDDVEQMQDEIDEMLADSMMLSRYGETAEEWAIHDYEGFGSLHIDEHLGLPTIARLAGGIEKHGPAFAAWASYVGETSDDLLEQFEDRFQGKWIAVESYADYLLDELDAQRTINEAPEWLQPYIKLDIEGFARDLQISGDIVVEERPEGGVWVWSGH